MKKNKIKELLKSKSLRATTTRVAVLEVLFKADRPLSHSQLVQDLKMIYGDQATIYRTLITFVEAEIIRIGSNVGGIARYEFIDHKHASRDIHPHFVCKECGIVSCLPKTTVISSVEEKWREILRASEVQFLGTCFKCSA